MKNHYKVLQVSRNSKNKEIKDKTKLLLNEIKKTNISNQEKNKLSAQVYESYKFLIDYHSRKSLDDYLDSQYKIVNNSSNFQDPFFGMISSFSVPFDLNEIENDFLKNKSNSKSYYYSKSSSTKGELDKNGDMIYKTKEVINDNGKKNENEFSKKINKDKIKPLTFIIN